MPIKHLTPKSEKEIRKNLGNLSWKEKFAFAKDNKLDWLKQEAEKDLKEIVPSLSLKDKFNYADVYKLDWLEEIATKEFKKTVTLPPAFAKILAFLKKHVSNIDYEIDFYWDVSYSLTLTFYAEKIPFLINQKVNKSEPFNPSIKVAKNLGDVYFFTDETVFITTDQMIKYIERKIKEIKDESKKS